MQSILYSILGFLVNVTAFRDDSLIRLQSSEKTIVVKQDGTQPREIRHVPYRGQLSPDGSHVLYVDTTDGDAEIFVADADGKNSKQLTQNTEIDNFPVWSPDGKRIAFASTRLGRWQVYVMDRDGDSVEQRTDETRGAWHPKFAPDGRLAFLAWRKQQGKALFVDLTVTDGKTSKPIVKNADIADFAFSPDGKTIACGTSGSLIFHDLATDKATKVAYPDIHSDLYAHAAHNLRWRPDSQSVICSITFLGGRRGGTRIFGDDELFIVPLAGKPTWFVLGVKPVNVEWVNASEAKRR